MVGRGSADIVVSGGLYAGKLVNEIGFGGAIPIELAGLSPVTTLAARQTTLMKDFFRCP
jgi:hypothetical protein